MGLSIGGALGTINIFMTIWGVSRRRIRQAVQTVLTRDDYASLLGRTVLTVDDAGLRWSNDQVETRLRWPAIREIDQSDRFIWLFYARNFGPGVPKRNFADDAAAAAFVEMVRARCTNLRRA